jgi:hypothetical protein
MTRGLSDCAFLRFLLTPDTRLRGRSRFGAAKARHLKPYMDSFRLNTLIGKQCIYAIMTAVDFLPLIFMVSGFLRMTCFRWRVSFFGGSDRSHFQSIKSFPPSEVFK